MMKTLMIAVALISFSAEASFYQIDCSSSTGDLTMSTGHVKNGIFLTYRDYSTGKNHEKTVKLSRADVEVVVLDKKEIDSDSSDSCVSGARSGIWQSTTTYWQEVKITRKDGAALFKASMSPPTTEITAHLICTDHKNSRTICK